MGWIQEWILSMKLHWVISWIVGGNWPKLYYIRENLHSNRIRKEDSFLPCAAVAHPSSDSTCRWVGDRSRPRFSDLCALGVTPFLTLTTINRFWVLEILGSNTLRGSEQTNSLIHPRFSARFSERRDPLHFTSRAYDRQIQWRFPRQWCWKDNKRNSGLTWKVGHPRDFGTFYGLSSVSWLLVSGSILEQFMSFIGRWETVQLKLAGQFHGLVLGAGMLHVPLLRRW